MPAIEVSCPSCNAINVIGMKPREPAEGGMAELLAAIAGGMGTKHYAFSGEKRCRECGGNIDVSINVTNSWPPEMERRPMEGEKP